MPETAQRAKILLVDDQPDNLLSAEVVLESLGEEIVTAASGREALWRVLREDFAVIVLDVMMPDMDGFETATLIRSRERSRRTPIIFLTALGRAEEHMFKGYDVGAVDYLFKPIVPQVLRSKVAVFVDLSKHRRLLETRNAQLEEAISRSERAERDVSQLNGHLERRLQELSALNRELEAFSYSVSHDLRSPLTRIAGFSQALIEGYADQFDETAKLYLNRIHASSNRVCHLVDELLKLARIGRTEMRRQEVSLSETARAVAAELQARDPERNVNLQIADGLSASGDPVLLRVAMQNLFENAWKFTRLRPRACIEFAASRHDGFPVFFVRDNGAGFDAALTGRLFQPFQRLHPESEFQGTGIGLATVERIVERHGGRIWAEGAVDAGATFYFTLQQVE